MKRTFEQDGFTVTVERIFDQERQCDTPEEAAKNYDADDADRPKYFEQDKARFESWRRDEWSYMGVAVSIRKQTATNWSDGGAIVGRDSLWGIESDSDEDYFASVEQDCIAEAWAEVKRLKEALCGA